MRFDGQEGEAYFGTVRLLQQHGRQDELSHLSAFKRGQAEMVPTVVVVGEVKRGKSTLVNALVGRPDLSPVGIDVVTAGFVRIVPPTADLPEGTARLQFADGGRRSIPAAEVAGWLTAGERPPAGADDVVAVGAEVAATPRWLPKVVLVDTPGVGGLESAHTRLARQAVKNAGALLFVTDAGQVLTAPELAFLQDVSTSVDSVVFALTKTDRYPAGWREVMAENRGLLERHAPRFAEAPIVPVAASLALAASAAPEHVRAAMEAASGLPDLAAELSRRMEDVGRLATRNTLRAARSALQILDADLRVRLRAVDATPAQRDAMVEDRRRLEELRERKQRWTLDLDRDLGRLRRASVDDIATRVEARREHWLQRVKRERLGLRPAVAQQYAAELDSDLTVLGEEVADGFRRRITDLLASMMGEVDPAGVLAEPQDAAMRVLRLTVTRRTSTRGGLLDPSLVGTTVVGMGLAGPLGVVGFPVVLLLGGAYLGANLFYKSVRLGREQLTQVVTDTFRGAESDLVAALDAALRELKPEIVVTFRDHLNARIGRLNAAVSEADRAAKADEKELEQRRVSATALVDAVTQQMALIDRVLQGSGTSAASAASNRRTDPTADRSAR